MEMIFCRGIRFSSSLGFSPLLATKNLFGEISTRRWRFKLERYPYRRNLSCNYVPFLNHVKAHEMPLKHKFNRNALVARYCNSNASKEYTPKTEMKKQSLFAKMKQMTKDYWHILVPVHIITSLGWVAIFYTTIKVGVDIVKLMEIVHFNQKYIDMVKRSDAGTWALTYLLYKIFTPLRYTVTLGGTTMAIRRLSKSGLVKPLSFRKQSQEIYKSAYDTVYNRIK
ncbi:protein FAM210A isoform X2 [Ceratina calcarata]|uniref:Protein FAM210A isoform X2 n=1 Tax=Ceratina calcarata TaxID=156304 RepID=A0AAJ7JG96_9HYME|nr:protein FAM210A isoform X2 [Ceratina calcarata]